MVELIQFPNLETTKQFLEASRDAVFIIFDEKIEYVNDRAVKLLGFSEASEIIGKWSCEFIFQDDKNVQYRPAGKNTPFRYELKLRRRDGSTVDVETQISIIEWGEKPSSLVFSRDITERKLFEAKLDAIHKHAVKINKIENPEELVKSTIEILKRELGFDIVEFGFVEGDSVSYTTINGHRTIREIPINGIGITVRAINTGEAQLVHDARKEQDFTSSQIIGDPVILSMLCVPIKVNDTVIGIINIESERLNAFDENDKKLLETLAEHVASSFAIIQEKEKLRKSLSELENLNRELDEYTYIVSHDLKAPLRSIQAFSEFLLDETITKLNDDEKDYLGKIIGASKRMTELIEDLLLLSRVNRKFLDVELVDLNEMIKEIEADLQSLITEKKAKVLNNGLPKIKGHRVWLKQIFSNLINNGLKFNESSAPTIHLAFEEHYDYYIFNVKDNGIGIKEEDYENIFKLFQRLDPQNKYLGTGAGLTICKKIVESYGGRIWVESRHGLGSTFYFSIPKNVYNEGAPGHSPIMEEHVQQEILE